MDGTYNGLDKKRLLILIVFLIIFIGCEREAASPRLVSYKFKNQKVHITTSDATPKIVAGVSSNIDFDEKMISKKEFQTILENSSSIFFLASSLDNNNSTLIRRLSTKTQNSVQPLRRHGRGRISTIQINTQKIENDNQNYILIYYNNYFGGEIKKIKPQ